MRYDNREWEIWRETTEGEEEDHDDDDTRTNEHTMLHIERTT